jgi:hypothetical protein
MAGALPRDKSSDDKTQPKKTNPKQGNKPVQDS